MSKSNDPFDQFTNPDYGSGLFRRRIRLAGEADVVVAELEDSNHGFRCSLFHDGSTVTEVHAETMRVPLSTCGGAVDPIRALIGTPLTLSTLEIRHAVSPSVNCTHLYDLTLLAIAHATRGCVERVYDLEVDDEQGGDPNESRAYCNGKLLFSWRARDWVISEGIHRGMPLYKGFSTWAEASLSGEEKEAAFALQKAYFVSQARRYDMDAMAGTSALEQSEMQGVCYSYSLPATAKPVRAENSVRDFTDCPEELLKFR